MTLRLLDTFAGIGGFSLGLEATGFFETVAFCEIEKFPRRVLAKHWPDVYCHDDIRTLRYTRPGDDPADWILYDEKDDHEIIRGPIDIISGGFPCQDLSVAGKRAGIKGERSGLWDHLARLIGEIRPRYAIVENVTALLSGDRGRWFGRVLGDLAALGYCVEWHCVPASSIGAPHRRDRVWIIAYPQHTDADVVGSHRAEVDLERGSESVDEQVGHAGPLRRILADAERPGEPADPGLHRRDEGGPEGDPRAPLLAREEGTLPADALAGRAHLGDREPSPDADGPLEGRRLKSKRGSDRRDAEPPGDGEEGTPRPGGLADAESGGLESSGRSGDASIQREDRPEDAHDRGPEEADPDDRDADRDGCTREGDPEVGQVPQGSSPDAGGVRGGVPDADGTRSQGPGRGELRSTQGPRQSRQTMADADGVGSHRTEGHEAESRGDREDDGLLERGGREGEVPDADGDGSRRETDDTRRREPHAPGSGRRSESEGRRTTGETRPTSEVADADVRGREELGEPQHRTVESSPGRESHGRGSGRRRDGQTVSDAEDDGPGRREQFPEGGEGPGNVADADEKREPGLSIGTASEHASTSQRREDLADAGSTRGEAGLPGQDPRQEGLPRIPLYESHRLGRWPTGDFWAIEPDVGRVAHGIPERVDRLKCLGNAIVPQIAQLIGYAIADDAGLL